MLIPSKVGIERSFAHPSWAKPDGSLDGLWLAELSLRQALRDENEPNEPNE